jgi:hypothetical protein
MDTYTCNHLRENDHMFSFLPCMWKCGETHQPTPLKKHARANTTSRATHTHSQTYTYSHTLTHIQAHTHTHTHAHKHTYTHKLFCIRIHALAYTIMHIFSRIYTGTCIFMRTTHAHTYRHSLTHLQGRTDTHTYKSKFMDEILLNSHPLTPPSHKF